MKKCWFVYGILVVAFATFVHADTEIDGNLTVTGAVRQVTSDSSHFTGKLGVGTNDAKALLHIHGSPGERVLLANGLILSEYDNTGAVQNVISLYSDSNLYIDNASGDIQFRPDATSGNVVMPRPATKVGIGLYNPQAKLHIGGGPGDRLLLENGIIISQRNSGGTVQNLFTLFTDDTMYLDNISGDIVLRPDPADGNVLLSRSATKLGIGTTSPLEKLHVNGAARFDEGVTYTKPLGDLSMGTFTNAP